MEVADYWGLKSRSNIQSGASWYLFNNQYGQGSYDYGRSILQTADGGYISAGNTSTLGNQNGDVLLLKVDESGIEQWIHSLTFSPSDRANMVLENSESGYIVVGNTISPVNLDLFIPFIILHNCSELQNLYFLICSKLEVTISSAISNLF